MVEVQPLIDAPDLELDPESDQSVFDASQMVLQPPPPSNQLSESQKKRRLLLFVLAGVIVVTIGILLFVPRKKVVVIAPSPTPEPTPVVSTNQMQQIINQVSLEVTQSNPEDVILPPPQVDMTVDF